MTSSSVPSLFLGFDQTAWTAIASIGSFLVVLVALIPLFLDKPNLKVQIKTLNENGRTGRYLFELSILNIGRRKVHVDNVVIEYNDFESHIINISDEMNEILEGKRLIIKEDSWPLTAISVPKHVFVFDSRGKKWFIKRRQFKYFMKQLVQINNEKPKTIREETKERKEKIRKDLVMKNSKYQVY